MFLLSTFCYNRFSSVILMHGKNQQVWICRVQIRNRDFVIIFFFFFFFKRFRARLVGPETMIQSPNCFALPCAGPFHKINAEYVYSNNNNCELYLPNVWLLLRRHFTKLTRDKCAALRMYACAHMRVAAFIRELRKICGTSVKIIQLRCRDAPCEKSWKQGNPLSNTIKDTSTIMRNPPYIVQTKGYA